MAYALVLNDAGVPVDMPLYARGACVRDGPDGAPDHGGMAGARAAVVARYWDVVRGVGCGLTHSFRAIS